MIAIDLSRQQQNGDEPKANQQINFTENLDPDGNTIKIFHYWRSKFLEIFRRNRESIRNLFYLDVI